MNIKNSTPLKEASLTHKEAYHRARLFILAVREQNEKKNNPEPTEDFGMPMKNPFKRYNNPGNIEAGQNFDGETEEKYGEDNRFATFSSPVYGLRALGKDLTTKINRGLTTVRSILEVYAPNDENKTERYIKFVENKIGKQDVTRNDIRDLIVAITTFENEKAFVDYYLQDPSLLNQAMNLLATNTKETVKTKLPIKKPMNLEE